MLENKKIRVTLPEHVYSAIQSDISDFGINKNRLCNEIFAIYHEKILNSLSAIRTKYNKIIQFNLNIKNIDIYEEIITRVCINNEADYFRNIFYAYTDQPKYKRELLIFRNNIDLIKAAIEKNKKLKIKYKNEFRTIEPYFIMNSDEESRNYVFCYCETNQAYRNYRITNFKPVSVLPINFEKYDADSIKKNKSNFDPFLSFEKIVKVKFTKAGIDLYKIINTNRPKLLNEEKDIFTFQCSNDKAKLYFPAFLGEAEILEPARLREWFKKKYEIAFNKYN